MEAKTKRDATYLGGGTITQMSLRDVEPVLTFVKRVSLLGAGISANMPNAASELLRVKKELVQACRDLQEGFGSAEVQAAKNVQPQVLIPKLLSIIVLAHNNWEFTRRCLDSINACTSSRYEIVLVDNGSTDETQNLPQFYPEVVYIRSEENLGVAKGRNLGLKHTKGDVLCYLDNDLEVTPCWDRKLLDVLGEPNIGMVGTHGSIKTTGDEFSTPSWTQGDVLSVDYLRGQCQMFRRGLLEVVGTEDENLVWHEDSEFSHRVKIAGLELRAVRIDMVQARNDDEADATWQRVHAEVRVGPSLSEAEAVA